MPNHGMGLKRRRAQKKALLKRDGNYCQDCREPFTTERPATFEHRIPVSLGGTNSRENLQLLCRACNQARNAAMKAGNCPTQPLACSEGGAPPCLR